MKSMKIPKQVFLSGKPSCYIVTAGCEYHPDRHYGRHHILITPSTNLIYNIDTHTCSDKYIFIYIDTHTRTVINVLCRLYIEYIHNTSPPGRFVPDIIKWQDKLSCIYFVILLVSLSYISLSLTSLINIQLDCDSPIY